MLSHTLDWEWQNKPNIGNFPITGNVYWSYQIDGGGFTPVLGWSQAGAFVMVGGVATVGLGVPALYGLDNRTGLTTADSVATTLYTSTAANQLYRVSAQIFATAAVTGTASYTITWTEHGTTQTMVVTSTTVNTQATTNQIIRPDNGTAITARLTFAAASGTFSVAGLVEQLA